MRGRFALLTALALALSVPAVVSAQAAGDSDIKKDRKDVRHDRRELHGDRKDIRHDTKDIRQDRRDIRQDRRDVREDVKEGDPKDARQDRRELRGDRRDVRQESGGFPAARGPGPAGIVAMRWGPRPPTAATCGRTGKTCTQIRSIRSISNRRRTAPPDRRTAGVARYAATPARRSLASAKIRTTVAPRMSAPPASDHALGVSLWIHHAQIGLSTGSSSSSNEAWRAGTCGMACDSST